MLNPDGYNLTEMRSECLYLKFELNLPQMPSSFEKWHSHFPARVKAHRKTGPDSARRPDGKNRMGNDNVASDQRIVLVRPCASPLAALQLGELDAACQRPANPILRRLHRRKRRLCNISPACATRSRRSAPRAPKRSPPSATGPAEGARVAYELLDSQFSDEKAPALAEATPAAPLTEAPVAADAPSAKEHRAAALNQPMPYRPPAEDESVSDKVVTGAIPLPTPKPVL